MNTIVGPDGAALGPLFNSVDADFANILYQYE
jgi:hypothetical protein